SIFSILAAVIYGLVKGGGEGITLATHALLALFFLLITNPTGSHALARAAHRAGIKPAGAVVDKLEEKE
ncbi:TPA: cation:proton antiporter, partial [Candidatus Micrarchaeota archaeon]|nr:cation:proton antiporter [Candidatus Micrarchaeota archaeon]